MRVNKVHHVAVICSDYAKSKRFYTEVLGFRVIAETFREVRNSFKLDLDIDGQTQLELFSFPHPPERPSRPEGCGLRHLAFEVDDIIATVQELVAKGVTVEEVRIDELTGRRYTFFQDPDGLPLEIYEK